MAKFEEGDLTTGAGKLILFLLVILTVSFAQAQNSPSLKDTTDWIHDFVEAHGGGFDHNWTDVFKITFNGCAVTVAETRKDRSCTRPENKDACGGSHTETSYITSTFNLKDFEPADVSHFVHTYGVYWLNLSVRNDRPLVQRRIKLSKDDSPLTSTDNNVDIGLSTENGARRVAKAFNHAIKICGGKPAVF
ncbi:MAG: hypothetical protein ACHP7I_03270 [Terriglobales bacterium]